MRHDEASETVPVLEEEVAVEKRSRVTGRVRIRSVVDEIPDVARAALDEERVEVTRVPIGREVTERPVVREEGDVLVIPLVEEVLVVEKKLVLREELHVRRLVTTETVEVPVTRRRERGVVERVSMDPEGPEEEST
ncbi:MAG: YsnF/AvaK domain-containing protein [Methylobacteriaceae bacterium]|nr:YsnF/AvaK domain-containing protein [Methylobacteriaceae bacterium]